MQRRKRTSESNSAGNEFPSPSGLKKNSSGKSLVPILVLLTSVMVVAFLTAIFAFHESGQLSNNYIVSGATSRLDVPRPQGIKNDQKPSPNNGEHEYHIIFSTGCSLFQDWQSYVFFYHGLKSGQLGRVTRIASGCSEADGETLKKLHKEQIEIMSDRFHLHLTPDFSTVKPNLTFKYFNKPFGLRHWMENALGFPNHPENQDAIIILLDPDQILLRPFTNDFTHSTEDWKPVKSNVPVKYKVEHGSPFAQQYGYSLQWKNKVNMTHISDGKGSRIDGMDIEEAKGHYAVGPPYIATAKDMYAIAVKWTEFAPRVYDNYPHLLAEMFAYSLAAAHLNLPHHIGFGFMVSDVRGYGEGWKVIDSMKPEGICENFPKKDLPHVLHYCQRYGLGKWFVGKYRLRKDFISCDADLLMEPPPSIAKLNYQIEPPDGLRVEFSKLISMRHAFMLCTLIPALNEAATFYKDHHCDGKASYSKSYIFHKSIEE